MVRRQAVPQPTTRGDVWLVTLDRTIGSESQKTRPSVIISPPEIHNHLRPVPAAPMATGSRPAPYRIPVRFDGKSGLILLDQIRTLNKQQPVQRLGMVETYTLTLTLDRLQAVLQLSN